LRCTIASSITIPTAVHTRRDAKSSRVVMMVTIAAAAAASVRASRHVVVRRSGTVRALSTARVPDASYRYWYRLTISPAPSVCRPLVRPLSSSSSVPSERLTSSDGVVATHPIDFDVASKIEGNESQICTISLEPGQVLRAESGAMMYMTEGISMNTTTGGGLSAGFKRMLTGQNVFISDYKYEGEPGTAGLVALGTDFPSKIIRLNINQYGGKIVAQQGALLCASHTVDINMEFTKKLSTGFFGGEGFVLQGLTGDGDVFLKAGGSLIRKDLDEGEELRIASGALVAFSNGVDFGESGASVTMAGSDAF